MTGDLRTASQLALRPLGHLIGQKHPTTGADAYLGYFRTRHPACDLPDEALSCLEVRISWAPNTTSAGFQRHGTGRRASGDSWTRFDRSDRFGSNSVHRLPNGQGVSTCASHSPTARDWRRPVEDTGPRRRSSGRLGGGRLSPSCATRTESPASPLRRRSTIIGCWYCATRSPVFPYFVGLGGR